MSMIAILHCSDIHCGPNLANNTFSWKDWKAEPHESILCLGMPSAMERMREVTELPDTEDLRIVVSGDLTATGTEAEFAVAHTFLRSRWQIAGAPLAGNLAGFDTRSPLDSADPGLETVAGNHDQWNGNRILMWGYNPALRNTHFRQTPWRRVWTSGALQVELFGLDSNAGFGTWEPNPFAFGSLDLSEKGEVKKLRRMLEKSDKDGLEPGVQARVRVLVLHHSPSFPPRLDHSLDKDSIHHLLSLAEEFRIAAFLTGHLHEFGWKPMPTPKGWWVRDLRCASTLQGPADRKRKRPGFWAHKIWLDGGQPHWTAWHFLWDHPERFKPSAKPKVDFIPGAPPP